ncbi:acetate--CoA ligase family protein [Candidatus Parcubacteria bacterium]|nr:acetate--CoA ligase family protein [Candidatus Parcubacteria bacterium]
MSLKKMLNPQSIAIVGANSRKGSVGYDLFKNILNSEYKGEVFPVNIKRSKVQGVKAYKNVVDLEQKVDLAIIAIPAFKVFEVVKNCAKKGIKNIIVISAGFSEIGKEGVDLSNEILEFIKKHDIRIIGPNCLGFLRPSINLNASFATQNAKEGSVAFISQSGAFCTAMLDWSRKNNVGFSNFISIGSMLDVGFYDLLKYLKDDKETKSILIYMESLTEAKKFIEIAKEVSLKKPIFVLKVGKSVEGASAAKSHTGSLTGNDEVFDVAFERAGIVRLETMNDLYNIAKLISMQGVFNNDKLVIITNAGGPGVITTDALINKHGKLAKISKNSIDKLNKVLPNSWSHGNPIDIIGDASPERYKKTVEICLQDKNIDSILILLTPQSMTKPDVVAEELLKVYFKHKNKLLLVSFLGGDDVLKGREIFEKENIPTFNTPELAINAFINIIKYNNLKRDIGKSSTPNKINFKKNFKKNVLILEKVKSEKRKSLTEKEAKLFLNNYEIFSAEHKVVNSKKEAEITATEIGFPVVMKISSPDILHKVDAGGVVVGVKNKKEAGEVFENIIKSVKKYNKNAKIEGVLIEKMVNKKFELLIGCMRDEIFGHVVVFGAGGTYVEILNDTAMELLPLNNFSADKIIKKTKIYQLLKGYRGQDGVDIQKLKEVLIKFSELLTDFPEIKELDINPYSIDKNGGVVLDAKILI